MIIYGPKPRIPYTIGGKATGLYRLQEAAVPVPPFLVIPAECFDPVLQSLPADEASVDLRRQHLEAFVLTPPDQAAIDQILADWQFPHQPVVVRSSVADEDGEKAAFPGLMDSFMNLTSRTDVQQAIARCAASVCSDRALAYRKQKGLTLAPRPAVIIQQQIWPVASGVLFTTFPDYPQELAIHAAFGFGEGIMSGALDADEFYWLKQTGQPHRQVIANKPQRLDAQTGNGLAFVAVAPEKQTMPCLTPDQSAALFRLGMMVEKAFGQPQDVEFVVTDHQIYAVQSRPITQPIPEVIVYDNANIQESYCGVTTPLTFSFASRAYATVYRQTMQTLGLSQPRIQEQEAVVTQLLGLVQGRIYYNINNWYRGLQLLPSFKQNKADMERMMGLDEPVDFVQDHEKTVRQKLTMLPGLVINLTRLLWAFSRLPKWVPAFHAQFQTHYHGFYQQPLSGMSRDALLAQKSTLDTALLGNWTTPIINDFYVMMTNGRVIRQLKKAGFTEPDEFLSRYLSGDKQIESTQPVRAMHQLAVLARRQTDLQVLIVAMPDNLHEQIQIRYPVFYAAVNHFIDHYGDRTVGELKLETVTMRLEPRVFYQYLRNYLRTDSPIVFPVVTEMTSLSTIEKKDDTSATTGNAVECITEPWAGTTGLHTQAVSELTDRLANHSARFRRSVRQNLAQLQQAIRYRESMRLERTRLFGMYRALYLALGEQLVNTGTLISARDIFYLTEAEISQAITTSTGTDLVGLIANRQREFDQYRQEDVPARVIVPSPPVATKPVAPEDPDALLGTGCVPGLLTGDVLVVADPRDNLDVTGKIVCALRTDPGWAVLFPACRAVLIEKGSSLSHSVILLRELGIPTIINIPGLTGRLHTGQTIRMNGSTGAITILT